MRKLFDIPDIQMKKTIVFLLLYFMIICLLSGCSSSNQSQKNVLKMEEANVISNISFSIDDASVTRTGLTYLIENNDIPEAVWSFGSSFYLESLANDEWELVRPIAETPFWTEILISVSSGKSSTQTVNWLDIYGQLEPGAYRLVKEFTRSEGKLVETYYLVADFDITPDM